jgi:hypothetical protein
MVTIHTDIFISGWVHTEAILTRRFRLWGLKDMDIEGVNI